MQSWRSSPSKMYDDFIVSALPQCPPWPLSPPHPSTRCRPFCFSICRLNPSVFFFLVPSPPFYPIFLSLSPSFSSPPLLLPFPLPWSPTSSPTPSPLCKCKERAPSPGFLPFPFPPTHPLSCATPPPPFPPSAPYESAPQTPRSRARPAGARGPSRGCCDGRGPPCGAPDRRTTGLQLGSRGNRSLNSSIKLHADHDFKIMI